MPKIVQYNLPPGGTVTQVADNQVALEIQSTDSKDYIEIDTTDSSEKMTLAGGAADVHVKGTLTMLDEKKIQMFKAGEGVSAYPRLELTAGSTSSIVSKTSTNHLYLGTNSTNRLNIDHLGKIATGTETASMSDHAGSIHIYTGDSQVTDISGSSDQLIIEGGDANTGLSIACRNTRQAEISFVANGTNSDRGAIRYQHHGHSDGEMMMFRVNDAIRATIDSAGKLGIGSTPVHMVHIQDGDLGIVTNSADEVGKSLVFTKSRNATDGSATVVQDNDVLGNIEFQGAEDGDSWASGAKIFARVNGTPGDGDMPTELVFGTSPDGSETPAECQIISQDGSTNFMQGISNWYISSDNTGNTPRFQIHAQASTATLETKGSAKLVLGTNDTERMQIDTSGNVGIAMTPGGSHKLDVTGTAGLSTGTAWTNTSDSRVKTDVQNIENALDKIKQLRPVSFKYTDDYLSVHQEIDGSKRYNSFIAEEYGQVFPDAVSNGGNLERVVTSGGDGVEEVRETLLANVQQFTPHDLNMYLVRAVQELLTRIEELENGG